MMSLLGRIFATPHAIEKTVDAVVSAGDKLVYTNEEREDSAQVRREWFLKYLDATQPQSLFRRFLAMLIGGLWALLVLAVVVAGLIGGWSEESPAAFIFKVLINIVDTPFSIIMAFYFGGHYVREIISTKNKPHIE